MQASGIQVSEKTFPAYQSTLNRIRQIAKPGIRLDLSPMRDLVSKLGNPWQAFPSVLVAGTNGKGSTCAFLSEILRKSGYKVGFYSSPHLSFYRERIVVKDQAENSSFNEEAWCSNFAELHEIIQNQNNTFTEFEILTALAFLIFKGEKVDIAVLETGMGGRLDATNVVDPIMSLFTRMGYDHREYLGDTLALIAGEKAGVLRKNAPAISVPQQSEASRQLERQSILLGANLRYTFAGELHAMNHSRQDFVYEGKTYEQSLMGVHQIENACLAIEAVRELIKFGFRVTDEHIYEGIKAAQWPARFETVFSSPTIVVDGAHNPDGCAALKQTLKQLNPRKPHLLILGILEGKDIPAILRALEPWGDEWIFTRSTSSRAVDPEKLLALAKSIGISKPFRTASRVGEACRMLFSDLDPKGTAVVTGSLTTAGEARRILKAVQIEP